jgi:DNA-binding GntR family transcriptional regulator
VQPSRADATEAFDARIAIETGMLQSISAPLPRAALARLKRHYKAEQAAIKQGEAGQRGYLLGDFHVCLAECVSSPVLADILRDLTARTTLIATLFQSTHDAARSCADHADIVAALEADDPAKAADIMRRHIAAVAAALGSPASLDPLEPLRQALQPSEKSTATRSSRRLFTDLIPSTPTATRAPTRRHKEN